LVLVSDTTYLDLIISSPILITYYPASLPFPPSLFSSLPRFSR
jgi:hypothetical protein